MNELIYNFLNQIDDPNIIKEISLEEIDNKNDLEEQVNFANKIIEVIKNETNEDDFLQLSVAQRAEQLLALLERQNSIHALSNRVEVIRPETSIASSSLFTGAVHEPQMFKELEKEISMS